jgi:uncharacterized protein
VRLHVRRHELSLPRWGFDGLRVALVSDLHAGAPGVDEHVVEEVVTTVNDQQPDLVALLGDFVDPSVRGGRRVAPPLVADRLRALQAPAFAVLGNHDWEHEGARMEDALRSAGIPLLENRAVEQRPGLWIAGVSDATTRVPRIKATLRDVPDGAGLLLLAHDPDLIRRVPPRVSLTLSGHTHGGQVHVPVLWRLWTPSRHRAGHVVQDGRHLYVTRGVGYSRLPIRWRAPSEIAVLTLRSAE